MTKFKESFLRLAKNQKKIQTWGGVLLIILAVISLIFLPQILWIVALSLFLFSALLAALNKIQSISYKELENNKLAIILMSDKETVRAMMEFWLYLLLYFVTSTDLVFVFVLFAIAFIAMCIILPKKISKYYEKQLIK